MTMEQWTNIDEVPGRTSRCVHVVLPKAHDELVQTKSNPVGGGGGGGGGSLAN